MLSEKLTGAGFVHYEISNFARRSTSYPSGRTSLHNSSYWNGTYYLGLGPSAHSYNGTSRLWNVSSLPEYINAMHENAGTFSVSEQLDGRAKYNDFIITRLRTMWGVSLDELRREFGKEQESYFLEKSERYISIKKLKKQGDNVKVLPEYFFISDAIIRELIV
jgi:oxygen-independent coproporphyrinogen-3 oxidase